jgi:DMSO/TMAO reductase YedYZ molybdopterin-dependent catalytic subunit
VTILTPPSLTRRSLLTIGAPALLLGGCDKLSTDPRSLSVLESAEGATMRWQRLIGRNALAREFTDADISPSFKPNGSKSVDTDDYLALAENGFADWRLKVDGLVARPLSLSLAQLRYLPQRTQITRHDCVEGWSAIGKWSGPQLGTILKAAGVLPQARYVMFLCADNYSGEPAKGGDQSAGLYYESIDMVDAFHPQTIMAHGMNGASLPVEHGAPLRLRVERQLGYKQAKYVMQIRLVDSFKGYGLGKGGYWPDRGYEWFAGI